MMDGQLSRIEPGASLESSPMSLVASAIEKGVDATQLEKLLDLQERFETSQAKKAYVIAMTEFQSSVPRIKKLKHVSFNSTSYAYAPLCDIVAAIAPTMLVCGLSYRWENDSQPDHLNVTCYITHVDGHCETTTLSAPFDNSGKKNTIQSVGSAFTYLQRYTLCAALGLAAADEDSDGRLEMSGPVEMMSEEQVMSIEQQLDLIKDKHGEELYVQCYDRIRSGYSRDADNPLASIPATNYAALRDGLSKTLEMQVDAA